jgi:hypothetical protein
LRFTAEDYCTGITFERKFGNNKSVVETLVLFPFFKYEVLVLPLLAFAQERGGALRSQGLDGSLDGKRRNN